jgi:alkylation response protein AidB-like acyl-CoA dehydrogenase
MDFDLPPDDDPRRAAVRAFLDEHPAPSRAELAAAGYVAPHWPDPWGVDADPEHQLIIDLEFAAAGVELPGASIGVGWAGPTILTGGTPEQQRRWLPGILDGSESWCQLFSEPDAGSDLAALRTQAIRDGDVYVVNGQKIWSTWANSSQWGILIARSDPSAPATTGKKQAGISYFALDMSSPGIEVRPIIEMTGGNHFNEVFFTDVRIPIECRIGPEHDGWRLAKVTLGNERLSLSEGGVIWGMGPTSPQFFDLVRREFLPLTPLHRQTAARVYTDAKVIELLGYRIMTMLLAKDPIAEAFASLRKTLADVHGQRLTSLMKDLQGADAMVGLQTPHGETDDLWHWSYLFSRALTIGGGTSEVQRNIIGERLLGLPREPPPKTPMPDPA